MQGMQFYQLGRFPQAVESFSKALSTSPQHGEAYLYRGASYYNLKDFKNCKTDLDQASKLLKNNTDVLLFYGYLYNDTKAFKKAITSLTSAISAKPNLANAYNARGYSYQSLGNFRAAMADYSSAIKADTTFALAYNNRGSAIYYNQDVAEPSKQDIKLAIKDFDKALQIEPRFCTARRNKGLAFSFLGLLDSAVSELGAAISCEPQNPLNYAVRGSVNIKRESYNEALNDFTQALERDNNYNEALIEMGIAKAYLGFSAEADADFNTAIKSDKRYSALAWYGMAVNAAKSNDKAKMFRHLEDIRKTGFFKSHSNRKRLADEKAFQPFKNDKDFRELQVKLK